MTFRLPAADEKAEYVLTQFDRIAANYDLLNDVISFGMHRHWKAQALSCLIENREGSYLDVCCGTGDLALRLADQLSPQASLSAVDFSANMLSVSAKRDADKRKNKPSYAKINWIQADAQALPFEDRLFDGAIIAFGLRNLTDLQKGINEMARVVKPGGKVVNLDLGHPQGILFAPTYRFYFQHVVPIIGAMLGGDRKAYTYLPSSLQTYPKPRGITAIFEKAGLTDICHHELALGSVALHVGTVT
jgi:demethylmenaquinone methyltransferase/2-methoxy-6-polyprenyl-1,4-benzoquinol methylase